MSFRAAPAAFLRPLIRSTAALAAAVLLASCGGGDPVERFDPQRVIVFGDESVALVDSGDHNARKYTVNALDGSGTPVCGNYAVWPQLLASAWGMVFAECNPNGITPRAFSYASAARQHAADVQAQIDDFIAAEGTFRAKDLVVVTSGLHDIVDAFLNLATADQRNNAVTAAATALGTQINRMVGQGAKVAFASVPNVGNTPWGRNPSRIEELTRLTRLFNETLRSTVVNDGRRVALVDAYESIRQTIYGIEPAFSNIVDPLCAPVDLSTPSPASTACTTNTLVTGGEPTGWLWADNLRLSPAAHARIATLAVDRVRAHPF